MNPLTIARSLAVSAAIVVAAIVIAARTLTPNDELARSPISVSQEPAESPVPPPSATLADASETAAAARLRELNQMSETFRNTTFLIAIRDAGFVCNELLGVYGGVNDSATWTASCSEMLAYTVRVASNGGLGIEPELQHVDSITPVVRRDLNGERVLPRPQQLERVLPPLPQR